MPITINTSLQDCEYHVRFEGVITPADLHDYFKAMMGSNNSFKGARVLLEIARTSLKGFSYREMRKFSSVTKQFEDQITGSRSAIFAASGLAYGLARMYISTRDMAYDFKVFRDREKALAWLNEVRPTD